MKYTLLLFISISHFLSALNAQNFSVEPNPAYDTADLDNSTTQPDYMQAYAEISNSTSDTLYLRWERVLEDTPDGWSTLVCEPNICLNPQVSTNDFVLYPNEVNRQLYVEAYPAMYVGGIPENGAVPGEGEVHLKITNLNNPADSLTAVYLFTLTGSPILDVSALELEAVNVFPNPVANYFTLSETNGIDRLVIYNILGHQVKSYEIIGSQRFKISDLPSGSYLINLFGENQQMLKTLHLQKL